MDLDNSKKTEPDLDTALRELGNAIAEQWRLPQIADWLTRQINRARTAWKAIS